MPRSRTQKQVARRIDIFYFRHSTAMRNVRRVLICLCAIAVVIWVGVSATGRSNTRTNWLDPVTLTMIHNPGELAPAHAMFERQCETCHVGEKPGQYTRRVTDQACMHCHDGAIHDAHQFVADDPSKISRKTFTLAMNDPNHTPTPMRSAGCIECHIEHRGQTALLGNKDRNCVLCHADLNQARTTQSENYAKVTAFEVNKHPRFGIFAKTSDGKWSDPPKLKFNHNFHFEQTDLKAVKDNCMACHTNQPPANVNAMDDQGGDDPAKKVPPYQDWSEADIAAAKTGQGLYMRPVSYAAHCAKCHPMALPPEIGGRVVHADMQTVSAQLAGLGGAFKAKLAAMSDDDRKAALTVTEGNGPRKTTREITEDEYAATQLGGLKSAVNDWAGTPVFTDANEEHLPDSFKKALTEKVSGDAPADAFVLTSYAAFAMQDSCAKCHDMKIESEGGGGRGRGGSSASGPPTISVEPTGLSSQPKRWFVYSRFDHRPHRNLTCVDCHGAVLKSGADKITNTMFARETGASDVLLPDIETCAACHKPGGESVQAATGACVSCHVFHDRSKERPANGPLMKANEQSPATQPAEPVNTAMR